MRHLPLVALVYLVAATTDVAARAVDQDAAKPSACPPSGLERPQPPPPTVTFSLSQPVARIDVNHPDVAMMLDATITGDWASLAQERPLVVEAISPAAGTTPPAVLRVVDVLESSAPTGSKRRWRLSAVVLNFPTNTTTLERQIKVTWGPHVSGPLAFSLTSAAASSFTWKVIGLPAEWNASGDWCLPVRFAVGGQRATATRVTARLIEQSSKQPIKSKFFLSLDDQKPAAATGKKLDDAVNNPEDAVYLCATASDPQPGKYQGSITISPSERPDAEPIVATLYATTSGAVAWGIGLLALGSVIGFLVRVLAPAWLQRSDALLLADLVKERAATLGERLRVVLARSAFEPVHTPEALASFETALAERLLEARKMVPRQIPSPFTVTFDTAAYQALLDQMTERLRKLDLLVDGMARAGGTAASNGIGAEALRDVLAGIDALALDTGAQTIDQVGRAVEAQVQRLQPPPPPGAAAAPAPTLAVRQTETRLVDVRGVSGLVWVTVTVLTFVAGLVYLVLQNPAFGVPMDFLSCLGWGFGVPIATTQLTGASFRDALGVTLPKL
jgi:hypothetical protein